MPGNNLGARPTYGIGAGGRGGMSSEIIAAPRLCGYTEIELAHAQMQRHRGCRID